jgi:hypothetical protein
VSTENPVLDNFIGLGELQEQFKRVSLQVSELADGPLTADSPTWRCESSLIPALGLTLRAGFEREDLVAALGPAGLQPEEVETVVFTEDPFLGERDVVARIGGNETLPEIFWEVNPGGGRPRSLQNPTQGLRITMAAVLVRDRSPEPQRPFRKGTMLATISFSVKPYAGKGQIQPVPLTDEVRKSNLLSRKTQCFVKVSDEIVRTRKLDEAVTVYVQEELLGFLQGRNPGNAEFQYVAVGVVINFLQQLTFAASREMRDWSEEDLESLESEGSVLIELISDKLGRVNRPHANGSPSVTETARMVKEDPLSVAAHLTALKDFTKHGRELVAPLDGLED